MAEPLWMNMFFPLLGIVINTDSREINLWLSFPFRGFKVKKLKVAFS